MKKFSLIVWSLIFSVYAFSQTGVYTNAENLRSDTIDILDYEIHLDISETIQYLILALNHLTQ